MQEYIVSAPIGQLSLIVAEKSRDILPKKDVDKVINSLGNLTTTDANLPYKRIDIEFNMLIDKILKSKDYQMSVASFCSIYFREIGFDDMSVFFASIVTKIEANVENMRHFDRGFVVGLFASCLMNDKFINKNETKINIPRNVQDAVKYIKSEGFKVHLDQEK